MIFDPSPQGSPEWHAARCGVLTASLFSTAVDVMQSNRDGRLKGGPSSASDQLAATLAIERITGRPYRNLFDSDAMRTGRQEEPKARAWYEERHNVIVQEAGLALTDDRRFGYSTDGFVFSTPGAIEVKTLVSPLRIAAFLRDPRSVVVDFIDQCDGGMWLCHLEWIDLIVWIALFEALSIDVDRRPVRIRIHRDDNRIERLVERLVSFDERVTELEGVFRNFDPDHLASMCEFKPEPVTDVAFREIPWDSSEQANPITKPSGKKNARPAPSSGRVAAVLDNPFNHIRS